MSFRKNLFASITACLVAATPACSGDDDKADAKPKQGAEGACEHLNAVCASTEGFTKQDCSITKASYAKLAAAQKAQVDAVVPCVMAASSCEPALACMQKKEEDSTTPNESSAQTTDAEAACEHINDVCSGTEGFKTQDCSSSNANYAKLSESEKATADSIAPCVMGADTCQGAFACLEDLTN